MTKEEFLAEPSDIWYSEKQPEVQTDWFAQAWRTSPEFKGELSYDLARYAKKVGEFLSDEIFVHLNQFLTLKEVLELHRYVLQVATRESDWRGEFERWFPLHASALPPIRSDDSLITET